MLEEWISDEAHVAQQAATACLIAGRRCRSANPRDLLPRCGDIRPPSPDGGLGGAAAGALGRAGLAIALSIGRWRPGLSLPRRVLRPAAVPGLSRKWASWWRPGAPFLMRQQSAQQAG